MENHYCKNYKINSNSEKTILLVVKINLAKI